jgi:hypothetical protein
MITDEALAGVDDLEARYFRLLSGVAEVRREVAAHVTGATSATDLQAKVEAILAGAVEVAGLAAGGAR